MTEAAALAQQPAATVAREQRTPKRITERERSSFLQLVAAGATMRQAAEALDRPRDAFREVLERDPKFAQAFELAFEASADVLEEVAWTRATVPDKWGKVSDRLLEMLLKARRPWRYRTSSTLEVTGAGGGPLRAEVTATVDHRAVLGVLAAAGLVAPALPVLEQPARVQAGTTPTP